MKPNLKTFPSCRGCHAFIISEDEPIGSCTLREPLDHEACLGNKWKDDFEAELRTYVENIESYRKGNFRILYDENYKVMRKVKEILGE